MLHMSADPDPEFDVEPALEKMDLDQEEKRNKERHCIQAQINRGDGEAGQEKETRNQKEGKRNKEAREKNEDEKNRSGKAKAKSNPRKIYSNQCVLRRKTLTVSERSKLQKESEVEPSKWL